MSDHVYFEALQSVQQRLSKPRNLVINTLLFSFVASIGGVLAALPYRLTYGFDGRVYLGIFCWVLLLLGHGVYNFVRSGAWTNHREQVIRTTLLELAHAHDLSTEELIELHQPLDDDIREQALPTYRVMLAVAGHAILWVGSFVLSIILSWLSRDFNGNGSYALVLQLPIFGSLLIGIIFSVTLASGLRYREKDSLREAHVRTLYTLQKAKRNERLEIDDEGEIIPAHDYEARQSNQR